jgi:protocatechuate 4,5-dioxygenase alpha subunit
VDEAMMKSNNPFVSPAVESAPPQEILDIHSTQIDYAHPIPGTYLTTGLRAARGYRFSKFCMAFMKPEDRDAFKADMEKVMTEHGLSDIEKQMIRDRDWNGMLRHGVSSFLLMKLANVLGTAQNQMRGQTYEEFMATRNVKDVR